MPQNSPLRQELVLWPKQEPHRQKTLVTPTVWILVEERHITCYKKMDI
jgi:hypothetical protein